MTKKSKAAIFTLLTIFVLNSIFIGISTINIENSKSKTKAQDFTISNINAQAQFNNFEKPDSRFELQQENSLQYEYEWNTIFETNASSYEPGDTVVINTTSSNFGINGTLSISIDTPIVENVFSFDRNADQVFFDDPDFLNSTVVDWTNNGFASIKVDSGKLNLTTNNATSEALAIYQKYSDIIGSFEITIDYSTDSSDNNLTLNFWNGTKYGTFELIRSETSRTETIFVNATGAPIGVFYFNLTNSQSIWLIDPIKISYKTDKIEVIDGASGILNQIWVHGVSEALDRDLIVIYYNISESPNEFDVTFAHFVFKLPENNLYLGDWLFKLSMIPIDSFDVNLPEKNYYVPIRITDDVQFTSLKQYVLRGTNTTTNMNIYEDESSESIIYSPGDNITLVGQFMSNSTNKLINSQYFSGLFGFLTSNTTNKANIDLFWGKNSDESAVRSSDPDAIDLAFGNLTYLPQNLQKNTTWIINYNIPNRGLYGSAMQNIILTFPSSITTTADNNETYSEDYNLSIELNDATIKFLVNITDEKLPVIRPWIITEFIEGNIKINALHYNVSNFSTKYNDNRTINFELDIPMDDIELSIFFKDQTTNDITLEFLVNQINQNFVFSGIIDPNLAIPNVYDLSVQWTAPLKENDNDIANLKFSSGSTTKAYSIGGTLTVQLPFEEIISYPGRNLQIRFNITIDQLLGRSATGLQLYALLDNSTSKSTIIEQDASYIILETLSLTASIRNNHIFIIYKESTDEILGRITFSIQIPPPDNLIQVEPTIGGLGIGYDFIGSLIILLIISGFIFALTKIRPKI